MSYGLLNAYVKNSASPSTEYLDDLQAIINDDFENASDIYTIQEELDKGSKKYTDVVVRIVHAINSNISETRLGDDYRGLIFKEMNHTYGMGYRYSFDDNIWLTVYSDLYHFPTASATIRRCNNVLNWLDENNNLLQEPCAMDKLSRDKPTFDDVPLPEGDVIITCQGNNNSQKIRINQRFVINRQAYKVKSIKNYMRQTTYNKDDVPLIYLGVYKDNEAPDDDLENDIANAKQYQYSLIINQGNFNQSVGYTVQLTATVKLNNQTVIKDLNWEVSDNTIARIDNNGNLLLINNGTANITCSLVDNPLVSNTITINVASRPVVTSEIIVSPDKSEIDEDDTVNFSIYKYTNGIKQSDTFNITTSGVPAKCYDVKIIDGNNFSVTNNQRYFGGLLNITCTDITDNSVKNINLKLSGGI